MDIDKLIAKELEDLGKEVEVTDQNILDSLNVKKMMDDSSYSVIDLIYKKMKTLNKKERKAFIEEIVKKNYFLQTEVMNMSLKEVNRKSNESK